MKILSIESSCDETAAAVVEDGRKVLSSFLYTQVEEHRLYGGVVPEIASRRHTEQVVRVTERALQEASLSLSELDAIAVTAAPGLIGALLVGVNFAKGLALSANKPLIPVHHLRGHIAANYLSHPELKPPFLCLVVSGGHSHIVRVKDYTQFEIIGKTRDDAAGEAFDKAARAMGYPYPGGVEIDRLTRQGGDRFAYSFPRPRVENAPYDFSFSGLKTAVINLLHHAEQKGETLNTADVAASFNHTVAEILTDRLIAAAIAGGDTVIALAGGVSANSLLREYASKKCEQHGLTLCFPPLSLCSDNAAMIGSQAYYEAQKGNFASLSLNACASMPIDQSFER